MASLITSSHPLQMSTASRLKVAFLHPDLGLGGAERLVVDAAAGMSRLGHRVKMYTSHYNPARSFSETRDGSFPVHVHGDWLPRHAFGAFFVLFAMLRSLYLAVVVSLFGGHVDVFVVDQVSVCIPVLRLLRPRAAVVFYCHFPDLLLSDRRTIWKRIYRMPFDVLEEWTTGCAHDIVVNSGFTQDMFAKTFTRIAKTGRKPSILYPCIAIADAPPSPPQPSPRILLSINRFERKKDIGLAIRAFAAVVRSGGAAAEGVHLIVAGGYDPRLVENVEHYAELRTLAVQEGLVGPQESASSDLCAVVQSWPSAPSANVESFKRVTFVRSFSDAEKAALLAAARAVLYTPANEHFGIVPLEAMTAQRPVIAVASGGPLESIRDGETGYLCEPTAEAFASAITAVLAMGPSSLAAMGRAGRSHVVGRFSREAFAKQLEQVCVAQVEAAGAGRARAFGQ